MELRRPTLAMPETGALARPWHSRRGWTLAAAALALLLAPLLAGGYELFLLGSILVTAIALQGLGILVGQCGILSLGHGAVFALGAYGGTLLMTRAGVPMPLVPLAAGVLCLAFGRVFAFAVLKLEGMPFALATLGLAIVVPQLARSDLLSHWTGGMQGINFTRHVPPTWLAVGDDAWIYLVILGYVILSTALVTRLATGPTGRAWRAARDHMMAAAAMGIDIARQRRSAFAVSCMLAGVAGALHALLVQYVAPDSFPFFLSLALFIGTVVGGVGTMLGPFLGAAFLVLIPNFAEELSQALTGAIFGAVVILLMALEERGLAALASRLFQLVLASARNLRARRSLVHHSSGDNP